MARGNLTFKQSDMTRAIRAVRAAGCEVAQVRVDRDGSLVVILGEPQAANDNGASTTNEWEGARL